MPKSNLNSWKFLTNFPGYYVHMILLIGFFMLFLTACGIEANPQLNSENTPGLESPTIENNSEQATPDRLDLPSTKLPERIPPTEVIELVTGEVPNILVDQVMADLEDRIGLSANTFVVKIAQAVVWNDGAMGCPEPGQFYTQATVDGYQIIIEANQKEYDYHASEKGYFILCENSLQQILPQGTPES